MPRTERKEEKKGEDDKDKKEILESRKKYYRC